MNEPRSASSPFGRRSTSGTTSVVNASSSRPSGNALQFVRFQPHVATPVFKLDKVLVVGYGNIGRIKAPIWKSLGLDVVIHDINSHAADVARRHGYTVYDMRSPLSGQYMLDVSTPAGSHFEALTWALAHVASLPTAVLIEKPLASGHEELSLFESFADTPVGRALGNRIFVDESYFSSRALTLTNDIILQANEVIESLDIELSKNRLLDCHGGRFFDADLGAIGIEVPHMLAILQLLGVDPALLAASAATLLIDAERHENQAFVFHARAAEADIRLTSYLGNFRLHDNRLVKNEGVVRRVRIATNKGRYVLDLDPVPHLPRYYARLQAASSVTANTQAIIADNHLRSHLSLFAVEEMGGVELGRFDLQSAVRDSRRLVDIRRASHIHIVDHERTQGL